MQQDNNLLSVIQFSQKHRAFSESSLRWLIFHAKTRQCSTKIISGNGLDSALIRIGRRIYIDEEKFFLWVEEQQIEKTQ